VGKGLLDPSLILHMPFHFLRKNFKQKLSQGYLKYIEQPVKKVLYWRMLIPYCSIKLLRVSPSLPFFRRSTVFLTV